jgi:hypothetical protein
VFAEAVPTIRTAAKAIAVAVFFKFFIFFSPFVFYFVKAFIFGFVVVVNFLKAYLPGGLSFDSAYLSGQLDYCPSHISRKTGKNISLKNRNYFFDGNNLMFSYGGSSFTL